MKRSFNSIGTSEHVEKQRIEAKTRWAPEDVEWDKINLSPMDDKRLADWHGDHSPESRGDRLAQQEWQRRITMRQIRAGYRSAIIAGGFGLLGTLLGWALSEYSHSNSASGAQSQSQSSSQHTQQSSKSVP